MHGLERNNFIHQYITSICTAEIVYQLQYFKALFFFQRHVCIIHLVLVYILYFEVPVHVL